MLSKQKTTTFKYLLIYPFVYTMKIENIKRKRRGNNKTVLITIRITPEISRWLKKNDYSPTGIFYEAIRELGYEGNGSE